MKRTAMKVFAALIALCILLGALPISASADARYASTILSENISDTQGVIGWI